jgi:anti-sigma regulatory factor (Ser/Thr protein kinase)
MMPFRSTITDLRELRPLRASLNAWLRDAGMAESSRDNLVLATHEAVANAIQHAGSADPVLVHARENERGFVIDVSDAGRWVVREAPPPEGRGRGLQMINALVSRADVVAKKGGTTVRLHQAR